MNYIPFPREDKDNHADLVAWRSNANKVEGDWTDLKPYLSDTCRLKDGVHTITKCWYSELHQGDNYALDVEHCRPKNAAEPLNKKQVKDIENTTGENFLQDVATGNSYPWLQFEYRNYRIVTALTNRAGAKHIYFPIVKDTTRLAAGTYPWNTEEFPFFLDPAIKHDADLLLVEPSGRIIPKAPKTPLTQADIDALPGSWETDAFNYTRAEVTIKMYRLNDAVFVEGRKELFRRVSREMKALLHAINYNAPELIDHSTENLYDYILPSAQFSLAAKCAMMAYIPDAKFGVPTIDIFNKTVKSILDKMEDLVNNTIVDWTKP